MTAAPNSIFRRLLVAGAAASLAGCLGPFSTAQPVPFESPKLRPEVFFAGRTQGIGTLTQLIGGQETLRVEGRGRTGADGVFRLDQVVRFADGRVEERTWLLRMTGPGAYAASLSDAAGPVSLEVTGNRAEIRYLLRRPAVRVHQALYLRPDGRSVLNQATITVLGIPWARSGLSALKFPNCQPSLAPANASTPQTKKPGALSSPGFSVRRWPGGNLLSRARLHTIIGANPFHGPVRDGKVWFQAAVAAR